MFAHTLGLNNFITFPWYQETPYFITQSMPQQIPLAASLASFPQLTTTNLLYCIKMVMTLLKEYIFSALIQDKMQFSHKTYKIHLAAKKEALQVNRKV